MDVGVSSMQLDQPARGFAFAADGPLDMRMEKAGLSAADFLNTAPEGQIADVLFQYGEERQSRRVARAIVAARPLSTTGEFAHVVRKALGHNPNFKGPGAPKDPATRSFQAVRIHVNAELEELEQGLLGAEALLRSGGRLAVVSFHSLEDRIVKQFLRDASGALMGGSRHLPASRAAGGPDVPGCRQGGASVRCRSLAQPPRALGHSAGRIADRSASARKEGRGMNLTRDRVRSFGWAVILTVCLVLTLVLTFRVNAIKSQVRLTERQIVALKQEKINLETEFETRANQQQLRAVNDVEFGYEAPKADQYIEGERQLAVFGKPSGPGAPSPIRVARQDVGESDASAFPAMVSPLTGKALAAEVPAGGARRPAQAADLKDRLARIELRAGNTASAPSERKGTAEE